MPLLRLLAPPLLSAAAYAGPVAVPVPARAAFPAPVAIAASEFAFPAGLSYSKNLRLPSPSAVLGRGRKPSNLAAVPEIPGGRVNLPGSIALIQYDADARFGDYEANVRNLTRMALDAVRKGAKIIVFPEGSSYGYADARRLWCRPGMAAFKGKACRDVSAAAELVPGGRSTDYWSEFSRRYGVFVLFSVPEADGGKFYNTLGVAGPSGYAGKYRKRLLYETDEAYASEGAEPFVLDTPYGRFGLMICMDIWLNPGYYEEYRRMGADAIIISMNWDDNPNGKQSAREVFRERAQANGMDIYASDSSPWDGTGKYPASGDRRERSRGLDRIAIGGEGLSVHSFKY
jgi:predicted amidohydrolase